MGLFDSLKKLISQPPPPPASTEADSGDDDAPEASEAYDLAGFDPGREDDFFNAVLHMESEGEMGGTDASRAEIMARFGIRDRSHWQGVKQSVYQALASRYGSFDAVHQAETNFRMGQMQRARQSAVAAKAATGELAPVEGISLEQWAAMNAGIAQGLNVDDLLKGQGIDRARWDRVSAEWMARMSRDTTFAISTVYGNAFQAASQGQYSHYAKEANAARGENRELTLAPPMSIEQYYDILFEQAYASKQGKDAAQTLKSLGLSIVDWCDLSSYMGYYFYRTWARNIQQYQAAMAAAEARCQAKYPGVKADVDISF